MSAYQAEVIQRYEKRIAQLEAQLADEIAHRTTGGTPPGYMPWANQDSGPPPTANDEKAPPLRRKPCPT